jgi:hypothetical protein
MSNIRIRGCYASDINSMVVIIEQYSTSACEYEVEKYKKYMINAKVKQILNDNDYSISDCVNIIMKFGNIYQAMKKINFSKLENYDELSLHRELATPFIRDIISDKIREKLFIRKNKKENNEITCSICLDSVSPYHMKLTSCGHPFHKSCLLRWGKNSCPMCRNKI